MSQINEFVKIFWVKTDGKRLETVLEKEKAELMLWKHLIPLKECNQLIDAGII